MNEKRKMPMTISVPVSAAVATLLLCGLQAASAQDTDEVLVEVGECIDIEAPVERLACFAAQVEQALTESEAAAADDGDAEAADSDADAAIGRTVEAVPAQPAEPEPARPAIAIQDSGEAQEAEADTNVGASETQAEEDEQNFFERRRARRAARSAEREAERTAEAEAGVAATSDAQADADDLNWFERRRARRAARAAEREAAEQAERAAAAENEILATIADLRERQPNAWLITLDNGQMWDQVRPQWYPLTPGDEVRLYPTNWGSSYRLTETSRGGYIQVQRVR